MKGGLETIKIFQQNFDFVGGPEIKGVTCFSLREAKRFWTDVIIGLPSFSISIFVVEINGMFYSKKLLNSHSLAKSLTNCLSLKV